jgi:four helix bundle protein
MQFDHEKLEVYKVSIEFSRFVAGLMRHLDGTHHSLKDQLIRACLSIPLNIAEGNGKRSMSDRSRFLEIARGSAMECAATLDVLAVFDERLGEELVRGKHLLHRIVSMLSRMTELRCNFVKEDEAEYTKSLALGIEHEHEQEHEHENSESTK